MNARARPPRIAAGAVLVACLTGVHNPAAATPRTPEAVDVWTINLHQMLLNEARLFDRMRAPRPPDVVAVQELAKKRQSVFMRRLRVAVPEVRWAARHGEDRRYLGPTGEMQDNTMVVWDSDRFAIKSDARNHSVLRWPQWIDCEGDPGRGNTAIAVRLWDRSTRRFLVVTSVRWRYTDARSCMVSNTTGFDAAIESAWPQRAMTILMGDFNAHPQPHECTEAACPSGRQVDPDCWYRMLSPDVLDNCVEDAVHDDPTYFDSVFVVARSFRYFGDLI